MTYAYVVFYRPCQWWGWFIAVYQLLRGCKYWQLTHCEVMTDEGLYAYRIDGPEHGSKVASVPTPDKYVRIPHLSGRFTRYKRSRKFYRRFGDFTPLSVVNGRHCVKYTSYLLEIPAVSRLPGALAYELEGIYDLT